MEEALKAASGEGNIDALYKLIEKDPEILDSFNKVQFVHTPLHEAAKAGQVDFAIELMTLMPSFGRKLNPQGLSPLHVAIIDEADEPEERRRRKNETALALIKLDAELIRVKGRERMTALHHAVKENNLELLAEFLCVCPNAIDDLTNKFQSAVHIAVKERKLEALDVLLGWLLRRNREDVLGFKDEHRNTALHIAVETEQAEVVKKLIHKVKTNSLNSKNLTALDIAVQKQNLQIKEILQRGGGRSAALIPPMEVLPQFLRSREGFAERPLRLLIYMEKEMSFDMRNVILVVAVLIVTAAFQGILQPPGGFWQGNAEITNQTVSRINSANNRANLDVYDIRKQFQAKQVAGKVVMSYHNFNEFIAGNTVAFVFATMVIFSVLPGRPYILGLHISLVFLTYSYLNAIQIIAELSKSTKFLIIISWFVISVAFGVRIFLFIAKALFYDAWWLPRLSLLATNSLYQIPIKGVERIIQFGYRLKMQHRVSRL
ncbi:ankyrin repeat-containing protein BDA1-like [Coffea arabica]|uniref:Ankyrin repeat-containing protein BDA1-like n=1 Tax=Coffea arabica TaxID=13443 RepID=A0ABM4VCL3_COFAR